MYLFIGGGLRRLSLNKTIVLCVSSTGQRERAHQILCAGRNFLEPHLMSMSLRLFISPRGSHVLITLFH